MMNNPDTQTTLETRHRTKTNKVKNTTQNTNKIGTLTTINLSDPFLILKHVLPFYGLTIRMKIDAERGAVVVVIVW
jgi:hypothetical protein